MARSPWTASAQELDRWILILAAGALVLAMLGALLALRVTIRSRATVLAPPAGRHVERETHPAMPPPQTVMRDVPSRTEEHPAVSGRRPPIRAATPSAPVARAAPMFVPVPAAPVPADVPPDDEELLQVLEPDPRSDHHASEH